MENEPMEYEAGEDQNQGVVGTMARNQQHGDTEIEGTQEAGLDPNLVTNGLDITAENEADEPATDRIGEQEFVADQGID